MPRYAANLKQVINNANTYGIELRHVKEIFYQIISAVAGGYDYCSLLLVFSYG